ncbi:MAG: hypothetical protein AAF657_37940, partial [Acidobacteriota bacterium]
SHLREYARTARRLWQDYEKQPDPAAFKRLRGDDPAHLVKVALGEALELVEAEGEPGIELQLQSEIPIGAGFGSSAAAAVAIGRAYLAWRGIELSLADLERFGLEVERRQHGLPSGIDSTTVIRGGLVWALRDPAGRFSATSVTSGSPALDRIRVFNSGTPTESTGAVVAAVRALRDRDPGRFEGVLERMEGATRTVRQLLEDGGIAPERLVAPLREFEACLEHCGVVPPALCRIVRLVEAQGGAAKISGAGALTGLGAGSLLVYHPEPQRIDRWDFLADLERLDVRLGAPGVRLDEGC